MFPFKKYSKKMNKEKIIKKSNFLKGGVSRWKLEPKLKKKKEQRGGATHAAELSNKQLKAALKKRGLSNKGKRAERIARLTEAIASDGTRVVDYSAIGDFDAVRRQEANEEDKRLAAEEDARRQVEQDFITKLNELNVTTIPKEKVNIINHIKKYSDNLRNIYNTFDEKSDIKLHIQKLLISKIVLILLKEKKKFLPKNVFITNRLFEEDKIRRGPGPVKMCTNVFIKKFNNSINKLHKELVNINKKNIPKSESTRNDEILQNIKDSHNIKNLNETTINMLKEWTEMIALINGKLTGDETCTVATKKKACYDTLYEKYKTCFFPSFDIEDNTNFVFEPTMVNFGDHNTANVSKKILFECLKRNMATDEELPQHITNFINDNNNELKAEEKITSTWNKLFKQTQEYNTFYDKLLKESIEKIIENLKNLKDYVDYEVNIPGGRKKFNGFPIDDRTSTQQFNFFDDIQTQTFIDEKSLLNKYNEITKLLRKKGAEPNILSIIKVEDKYPEYSHYFLTQEIAKNPLGHFEGKQRTYKSRGWLDYVNPTENIAYEMYTYILQYIIFSVYMMIFLLITSIRNEIRKMESNYDELAKFLFHNDRSLPTEGEEGEGEKKMNYKDYIVKKTENDLINKLMNFTEADITKHSEENPSIRELTNDLIQVKGNTNFLNIYDLVIYILNEKFPWLKGASRTGTVPPTPTWANYNYCLKEDYESRACAAEGGKVVKERKGFTEFINLEKNTTLSDLFALLAPPNYSILNTKQHIDNIIDSATKDRKKYTYD